MRKILIVDDNVFEQKLLQSIIENQYECIFALDGDEAMKILKQKYRIISAVVLDIMMPKVDGYEVIKMMRKNTFYVSIPIIVTTSLDNNESKEKAMEFGANAYLTKPFSRSLLLNTINNMVKIKESSALINVLWHDKLTGLLNKESFMIEAEKMIKEKPVEYYTLSSIDIEGYKILNDQYGSFIGDEIIKHVANCLNNSIAKKDSVVCRVAADKFLILFPTYEKNSPIIVENHNKIIRPQCIKNKIRIRIGRYLVNDLSVPIIKMIDRATFAEESLKGRIDKYIADYDDSMVSKLAIEQNIIIEMEEALRNKEFVPFLQPQFNHYSGALIGAEALIRWKKNGKFIPPNEFIPIFERNGFIYQMDKYVWEEVCKILRKWIDSGIEALPISINISRVDFFEIDFMESLIGIVDKYNIPHDLIRLEVTESAFSEESGTIIDNVNELIKLGFTVEIDDFGSGYSSLNTLKDVRAQILKLDMRFFKKTNNTQRSGNIIESVVRMARWLGMAVIAEGVEDQEHADFLKSIGCYYIQGYLYSKPISVEEYEKSYIDLIKESKLTRLVTVKNMDNNNFWSPTSMDTLMFNSYVGGACIFEYHDGVAELLRKNDQYEVELGAFGNKSFTMNEFGEVNYYTEENQRILFDCIHKAIETKKEHTCEIVFCYKDNPLIKEYIRVTVRAIAESGDRYILYCVIVNMTEQRIAEKKEKEIAKQMDIIMKNIGSGVSVACIDDGELTYLFNNDEFYDLIGYTKEQFEKECPNGLQDCIYPEDKDQVMNRYNELKEESHITINEFRIIRRDKSIIWLHADGTTCLFGDKKANLAVYTNITKLKEIERRELDLAKRLKAIMDNVNGSVSAFIMDDLGKTKLIFGNDLYFGLFGYTEKEAKEIDLDVMSLIVPKDFQMVVDKLNEVKRIGAATTFDYEAYKKDNSIIYVRANISIMRLEGYDDKVLVSVVTDITEKRLLEDQLQAIINNIYGGVSATVTKNGKSKFIIVNKKFFEIEGYDSEEEYIKNHVDQYSSIYYKDRERIRKTFTTSDGGKKQYTMEYRIIRRDGVMRYLRNNISVIRLFGIEEPVQLSVIIDITDQVEARIKEEDAYKQLQFLNNSANDIISQPNPEKAIDKILHSLLDYFDADRSYIVEFEKSLNVYNNSYEICRPGIVSETELLHNTPFNISELSVNYFYKNEVVIINDINDLPDSEANLKKILELQNIKSLIATPLFQNGVFIGFTGIDNPRQAINEIKQLRAISDYICLLLSRRDLVNKVNKDTFLTKQLLEDIPGGYAHILIGDDGSLSTVYVNDNFCNMRAMNKEEIFATEGQNSMCNVHPDDLPIIAKQLKNINMDTISATMEYRMKCGNGIYKWFSVFARKLINDDGKPYIVAYYRDITEQKKEEETNKINRQLRTMLNRISNGITAVSLQGDNIQFLFANNRFYELHETTQDEFRRKKLINSLAFVVDDDKEKVHSFIQNIVIMGKHDSIEYRIKRKDGLIRWLYTSTDVIDLADVDHPVQVTIYNDITEQKENQMQLELLNDSIPGGIATFRCLPNKIEALYYNEGICSLLEYSRNDFEKNKDRILDLIIEEDRKIIKEQYLLLQNGNVSIDYVVRIETKTGKTKWIHCISRLISKENETTFILNTVITNITEQQEEKERLRLAEESYSIATKQSGYVIGRYDIIKRELTIGKGSAEKFSLPIIIKNIPYGKESLKNISPKTVDDYISFYERIFNGEKECTALFEKYVDDKYCWIKAFSTTIFNKDNKPINAIISFTDVTEQLEKESIYNKWQQELTEKNENTYKLYRFNLNTNTVYDYNKGKLFDFYIDESLQKSFNEYTNAFARENVSIDDIDNYLSVVDANRMLADFHRGLKKEYVEFRRITKNGELNWTKLTIELVEYPNSKDVAAYLMYEDIHEIKESELATLLQAESDPLTGLLNRKTFEIKVNNVLNNKQKGKINALFLIDMDGFKYVNDTFGHAIGDQVLIKIGETIKSVIRDTDYASRMGGDEFLVFLKDMPDKESILNKAKQICESTHQNFNLNIQVSISLGIAVTPSDGTSFATLYNKADKALYYVKENGKNNYAFYNRNTKESESKLKNNDLKKVKKNILLVDDNMLILNIMENILLEDYAIHKECNGQDALIYLRRYPKEVDLILLDLMMPRMNGFVVLDNVKKDIQLKNIPIIVVSGLEDRETIFTAIRSGAYDYVTKPVEPGILKQRVKNALERKN